MAVLNATRSPLDYSLSLPAEWNFEPRMQERKSDSADANRELRMQALRKYGRLHMLMMMMMVMMMMVVVVVVVVNGSGSLSGPLQ